MKAIGIGASAFGGRVLGQIKEGSLKEQAKLEEASGEFNAREFRKIASAQVSSGRAARAASGVEASTGSPLLVDQATVSQVLLHEQNIKTQAQNRARVLRNEAKFQKRARKINLLTQSLSGASDIQGGFGK